MIKNSTTIDWGADKKFQDPVEKYKVKEGEFDCFSV